MAFSPLQSLPPEAYYNLFALGALMMLLGVVLGLAWLVNKATTPLLGVAGAVLLYYLAWVPTIPVLSSVVSSSTVSELVKALLAGISTRFLVVWLSPETPDGFDIDLHSLFRLGLISGFSSLSCGTMLLNSFSSRTSE